MGIRQRTQTGQGVTAISICTVGIATSPLLYKLAFAAGLHALWANVIRILVTVIVMLAVSFLHPASRKALLRTSRSAFWITALAGLLLALHLSCWALALVYTDSLAASAILGTYVLLTALFAAIFLREKTSKGALAGLVLATIGVVVTNLGGGIGRLGGNLFALLAAVTQALYLLCGRTARRELGAVPYTTILYSFALAGMVAIALLAGAPPVFPADGVRWSAILAITSTIFGHSMANVALKYFKATTVSALMMTGIITGPLVVLLFLGETIPASTVIGGAIIIAGLAWYMLIERRETRLTAGQTIVAD